MNMTKAVAVGLVATTLCGNLAWAENRVTPTERGAVAETDRYRAEFRDGVLTSFFNKLTGEEYLDRAANMDAILPHLPGGLGTQHAPEEREAARKLFDSPWGEQPPTSTWPNQHYADGKSVPAITVDGKLVKAAKAGRQWRIPARGDSFVAVLFAEPQSGFDAVAENRPLTRIVEIATRRDLFRPEFFSADLAQKHTGLTIGQERRKNGFNPRPAEYQTFIPIKAPAADGVLRIVQTAIGKPPNKKTPVAVEWRINGRLVQPANTGVKLPLKASEMALLSVSATVDVTCTFEWQ
jgi:hypothetical protein